MVERFLREGAVERLRDLETLAPDATMRIHRHRRARLNREPRFRSAGATVAAVAAIYAEG